MFPALPAAFVGIFISSCMRWQGVGICHHQQLAGTGLVAGRGRLVSAHQGGQEHCCRACALQGGSLGAQSSSSRCSLGSQPEVKPPVAPAGLDQVPSKCPPAKSCPVSLPFTRPRAVASLQQGKTHPPLCWRSNQH